jgi:hypothetical protein
VADLETAIRFRPYLIRLVIVIVISLVAVAVFNEAVYLVQKDENDRGPKTITLVIPNGTAQRIQAGEQVETIPPEMVFVVGDVLEVVNEDTVSHQLGPVWVPPGSTGKLVMEKAEASAVNCSFQSSQFLGLDVRQAVTWRTRLTALSFAAPTVAALMFIYSLLLYPIGGKKGVSTVQG